jgi:hypothetical protein
MYEQSFRSIISVILNYFNLYGSTIFVLFDKYLASAISAPTENKRTEHVKDDGLPVDIKLPVKHILSRELQVL